MANYKFVDADQLDSDLSSIANVIRKKGGTSASMSFPNGFSSAINAISTGVTVKRYPASGLGTFTTDSNGVATVNCGFQPDVVYVKGVQDTDGDGTVSNSAAIVFSEENRKGPLTVMWAVSGLHEFLWTKTSTGFSVDIMAMDYDFNETLLKNATFNYVAIKYT